MIEQAVRVELTDKVVLSEWCPDWATEFEVLAEVLRTALDPRAARIDHIGSTSVPGLPAKDVIDVQVIVSDLDHDSIVKALTLAGFTHRSNILGDHIPAGWIGEPTEWAKLFFATPPGSRSGNVHVRVSGSPNERYALLFRDFMRANEATRDAWGRFKTELANATQNLLAYVSVKDPATDVLLALAERWAAETAWRVPTL